PLGPPPSSGATPRERGRAVIARSCTMSSTPTPAQPGTWMEFLNRVPIHGLRERNPTACAALGEGLRGLLQAIEAEQTTTQQLHKNEHLTAELIAALSQIGETLKEIGAQEAIRLWDHDTDIECGTGVLLLESILRSPNDIRREVDQMLRCADSCGGG